MLSFRQSLAALSTRRRATQPSRYIRTPASPAAPTRPDASEASAGGMSCGQRSFRCLRAAPAKPIGAVNLGQHRRFVRAVWSAGAGAASAPGQWKRSLRSHPPRRLVRSSSTCVAASSQPQRALRLRAAVNSASRMRSVCAPPAAPFGAEQLVMRRRLVPAAACAEAGSGGQIYFPAAHRLRPTRRADWCRRRRPASPSCPSCVVCWGWSGGEPFYRFAVPPPPLPRRPSTAG